MSQRRLPAAIYWRRRLLLLAVLIAIAWGAFQLTRSDDERQQADPTTPAATPKPAVTPASAEVDDTVAVNLTSADRACDPEKIRVTPAVDPGQTTKDFVDVGLVVSSTETKACTLVPDDADLIAVISANKTAIWDSRVCRSTVIGQPVALSPRWASLVTTRWSARGSGGSCSSKEAWATPGKYTLQVGTLGGEPGQATFALEAKPEPKKSEPTEDDSKKDEKKKDDSKNDEKKPSDDEETAKPGD